ncbi:MAG: epoxyqueuosine reductase QueH [Parcubacteria group bacterium]|nr:epoxyqueuosine reductase QueH [Parcubacteria group bacterium]
MNQEFRKKVLLHICCAPCSTASIERLKEKYNVTGIFFNPNIYPEEEYVKRLEEATKYCEKIGIELIEVGYNYKKWLNKIKGLEKESEGGKRCLKCYEMRLKKVSQEASNRDFDYFTTTLTISPYKNFKEIKEIGGKLGKEFGVKFLDIDFKEKDGFRKSVELSKKNKLYRQHYCGCEFSINE